MCDKMPNRDTDRTEIVELSANIDEAEHQPTRANARSEMLEPRWAKLIKLELQPAREWERKLTPLATATESTTLNV